MELLDPLFDKVRAWVTGDLAASCDIGEFLGEATAEKVWLVVAFAKHISAGQEQGGYGRIRALDDMIGSLVGRDSG